MLTLAGAGLLFAPPAADAWKCDRHPEKAHCTPSDDQRGHDETPRCEVECKCPCDETTTSSSTTTAPTTSTTVTTTPTPQPTYHQDPPPEVLSEVLVPPVVEERKPQRLVTLPHTGPGAALPMAGALLAIGGLAIVAGRR